MKRTKIKLLIDNKEKTVYQNVFTGEMFIKYNGDLLKCTWFDNDLMEVDFYGYAPTM